MRLRGADEGPPRPKEVGSRETSDRTTPDGGSSRLRNGRGGGSVRGQDEKAVSLHGEERHAAGEILEGPVGLGPAEDLADLSGERRSLELGILPDPFPDLVDLGIGEESARIELHAESRIVGRDKRVRRSGEIVEGSQGVGSEGAAPVRAQASR